MILAVSRLVAMGHKVQFTNSGGYIENERDGSKIPMHLKHGVYVINLWVKAGTPGSTGT